LHAAVLSPCNGSDQNLPGFGDAFRFVEAGKEDYGKFILGFQGQVAQGMGLFVGEAYNAFGGLGVDGEVASSFFTPLELACG